MSSHHKNRRRRFSRFKPMVNNDIDQGQSSQDGLETTSFVSDEVQSQLVESQPVEETTPQPQLSTVQETAAAPPSPIPPPVQNEYLEDDDEKDESLRSAYRKISKLEGERDECYKEIEDLRGLIHEIDEVLELDIAKDPVLFKALVPKERNADDPTTLFGRLVRLLRIYSRKQEEGQMSFADWAKAIPENRHALPSVRDDEDDDDDDLSVSSSDEDASDSDGDHSFDPRRQSMGPRVFDRLQSKLDRDDATGSGGSRRRRHRRRGHRGQGDTETDSSSGRDDWSRSGPVEETEAYRTLSAQLEEAEKKVQDAERKISSMQESMTALTQGREEARFMANRAVADLDREKNDKDQMQMENEQLQELLHMLLDGDITDIWGEGEEEADEEKEDEQFTRLDEITEAEDEDEEDEDEDKDEELQEPQEPQEHQGLQGLQGPQGPQEPQEPKEPQGQQEAKEPLAQVLPEEQQPPKTPTAQDVSKAVIMSPKTPKTPKMPKTPMAKTPMTKMPMTRTPMTRTPMAMTPRTPRMPKTPMSTAKTPRRTPLSAAQATPQWAIRTILRHRRRAPLGPGVFQSFLDVLLSIWLLLYRQKQNIGVVILWVCNLVVQLTRQHFGHMVHADSSWGRWMRSLGVPSSYSSFSSSSSYAISRTMRRFPRDELAELVLTLSVSVLSVVASVALYAAIVERNLWLDHNADFPRAYLQGYIMQYRRETAKIVSSGSYTSASIRSTLQATADRFRSPYHMCGCVPTLVDPRAVLEPPFYLWSYTQDAAVNVLRLAHLWVRNPSRIVSFLKG